MLLYFPAARKHFDSLQSNRNRRSSSGTLGGLLADLRQSRSDPASPVPGDSDSPSWRATTGAGTDSGFKGVGNASERRTQAMLFDSAYCGDFSQKKRASFDLTSGLASQYSGNGTSSPTLPPNPLSAFADCDGPYSALAGSDFHVRGAVTVASPKLPRFSTHGWPSRRRSSTEGDVDRADGLSSFGTSGRSTDSLLDERSARLPNVATGGGFSGEADDAYFGEGDGASTFADSTERGAVPIGESQTKDEQERPGLELGSTDEIPPQLRDVLWTMPPESPAAIAITAYFRQHEAGIARLGEDPRAALEGYGSPRPAMVTAALASASSSAGDLGSLVGPVGVLSGSGVCPSPPCGVSEAPGLWGLRAEPSAQWHAVGSVPWSGSVPHPASSTQHPPHPTYLPAFVLPVAVSPAGPAGPPNPLLRAAAPSAESHSEAASLFSPVLEAALEPPFLSQGSEEAGLEDPQPGQGFASAFVCSCTSPPMARSSDDHRSGGCVSPLSGLSRRASGGVLLTRSHSLTPPSQPELEAWGRSDALPSSPCSASPIDARVAKRRSSDSVTGVAIGANRVPFPRRGSLASLAGPPLPNSPMSPGARRSSSDLLGSHNLIRHRSSSDVFAPSARVGSVCSSFSLRQDSLLGARRGSRLDQIAGLGGVYSRSSSIADGQFLVDSSLAAVISRRSSLNSHLGTELLDDNDRDESVARPRGYQLPSDLPLAFIERYARYDSSATEELEGQLRAVADATYWKVLLWPPPVLEEFDTHRPAGTGPIALLAELFGDRCRVLDRLPECSRVSPLPVFNPHSAFRAAWLAIVGTTVLATAIALPYRLGFATLGGAAGEMATARYTAFEVATDAVVLLDMLLLLRLAFWRHLVLVTTWRSIMRCALRSSLPIGLLSLAPLVPCAMCNYSQPWLRVPLLFRVATLPSVFDELRPLLGPTAVDAHPYTVPRLRNLLLTFVSTAHFAAGLHGVASAAPATAGLARAAGVPVPYEATYSFALWRIVGTLSAFGNCNPEAEPTTSEMLAFSSFALGLSLVCLSHLFGTVCVLMYNLDAASTAFEQKIEAASLFVRSQALPSELAMRIYRYERVAWERGSGVYLKLTVNQVNATIRADIMHHICHAVVISAPLFGGCDPKFIELLMETMILEVYPQHEWVCHRGSIATCMYILLKGSASVVVDEARMIVVKRLDRGDFFGERALFGLEKRHASICARTTVDIAVLSSSSFTRLITSQPHMKGAIEEAKRSREEEMEDTRRGMVAVAKGYKTNKAGAFMRKATSEDLHAPLPAPMLAAPNRDQPLM